MTITTVGMVFVMACHLMCSRAISNTGVSEVDEYLMSFCRFCEELKTEQPTEKKVTVFVAALSYLGAHTYKDWFGLPVEVGQIPMQRHMHMCL